MKAKRSPRSRALEPRPSRTEGDTVFITLTRGQETAVSACDADLAEFRWAAWVNPCGAISARRSVYATGTARAKTELLHRVIAERMGISAAIVDHIDGNPLNNRRSNLRAADPFQSAQNVRRRKDNSSGYRGVSRRGNKWVAAIQCRGVHYRLGVFESAEAAYEAYCVAAKELYGEYARAM